MRPQEIRAIPLADRVKLADKPNLSTEEAGWLARYWLWEYMRCSIIRDVDGPLITSRQLSPLNRLGRGLARQVNMPPSYLGWLACHFPEDFALNPVAPVLALEAPDIIAGLPTSMGFWAACSAYTPSSFLSVIGANTDDAELRDEIAFHINIAGEVSPETVETDLQCLLPARVRQMDEAYQSYLLTFVRYGFVDDRFVDAKNSLR